MKRNISVSNMYTFLHADFEGVEFYASRQYVHYPKQERKRDFFPSDEKLEYHEVLTVSDLPLLIEQRVCGVEVSDLPCLASGNNFKLTSNGMTDIRSQGITVDNDY